jgi:amidohydrolase
MTGFSGKLNAMNSELTELRHGLHRDPELSGKEKHTAGMLQAFLQGCGPDSLITGLGGMGILCEYRGAVPGPCVLLRCDMDAVPVEEGLDLPYRSRNPGVSHKCGHDGHMAIMAGVALRLFKGRPRRGSVLLLFQPAEETGSGAAAVLSDGSFSSFSPDYAFALHNLPGFPMGTVVTSPGPFAQGSRGLIVKLAGRSSHAGEPLLGLSPSRAVAALIPLLEDLSDHLNGTVATVIHAVIGERAFGTSPEKAVVMATLRAPGKPGLEHLSRAAEDLAVRTAEAHGLKHAVSWTEEFPPTVNSPEADSIVRAAAESMGLDTAALEKPFPWSEDFGHFTERFPGALFGLGSGTGSPPLHDPSYDFPDELIATGTELFMTIIERITGT